MSGHYWADKDDQYQGLSYPAHCRDCCCARSWEALGIKTANSMSIPENIQMLRRALDAAQKAIKDHWLNEDEAGISKCNFCGSSVYTDDQLDHKPHCYLAYFNGGQP